MNGRRLAVFFGLTLFGLVVLHVVPLRGGERLSDWVDVAHVVGFGAVAFVGSLLFRRSTLKPLTREPVVFVAAGLFTTLLAVIAEAAQIPAGRDASLSDLLRDGFGIVAGLCLASALSLKHASRYALALTGVLSLVIGVLEPGRVIAARALVRAQLPVLISFDVGLETYAMRGNGTTIESIPAPAGWPVAGEVGMVTPTGLRRYPGIAFIGLPGNWTPYNELSFLIAAEREDLKAVTVQIHDVGHNDEYADRFNRLIDVTTTPRRITIALGDVRDAPRGRAMDMTAVDEFVVFADDAEHGGFLIDDVRLE